jgi:hypothetical protein
MQALRILAGVTALTAGGAALARWMDMESTAPQFKAQRLFPGLSDKLAEVTGLTIESKGKMFTVTRTQGGKWVLPGKGNFPADRDMVQSTLIALSETDLIEPRTARKDWHGRLDLGLPKDGGAGSIVTVLGVNGAKLGEIVAGKGVEGFNQGDKNAAYVRRMGEDQSYVALGKLQLKANETDWLDKRFLDYDRTRVAYAAVRPPKGPAFSVKRAKAEDENFVLETYLPRGRTLRTEREPNGVGQALLNFTIEDVAPVKDVDFSKASFAAFRTFNGVTLSFAIAQKSEDYWVTVTATGEDQPLPPPKPGETLPPRASAEAKAINDKAAGWAFKVPKFKGVLMTAPLEDLLAPVAGPLPGPAVDAPGQRIRRR